MRSTQEIKNMIGEAIRDKRLEKNMTQKQLAEAVGTRQATISSFEKGNIRSLTTLIDITNFLNMAFWENVKVM